MNSEVKEKWIAALRSGKYEQSKGTLRTVNNEFCCLGVLCDLYNQEQENNLWGQNENDLRDYTFLTEDKLPPSVVITWAGLYERNPSVNVDLYGYTQIRSVAEMNDQGFDFNEIADLIEAQL
jgi:hypothetical protein